MARGKIHIWAAGAILFFLGTQAATATESPEIFAPEFGAFNYDAENWIDLPLSAKKRNFAFPIPRSLPSTLRVLIFPHQGPYALPQGRESKVDEVTFKSQANCEMYPESSFARGAPLKSAAQIRFTYHDVARQALWLKCPARTTLVREKGLRSYDYQGTFFIKGVLGKGGRQEVHVVQHVPFETYLKGVIPAEMPASWHVEALKAQAIAARSYALFQFFRERLRAYTRHYDLDDTVYYQAYLGLSWMHDNSNQAVDATTGLVLWHNEQPAQAYFSADSGGYTELAENVWSVPCTFCVSKPEVYDLGLGPKPWSVTFPIEEIEKNLRKSNFYSGDAKLVSVRVDNRNINKSGRVMKVECRFSDGNRIQVFGPSFQRVMRMRSNLFTVKETTGVNGENQFEFNGRGFGHGVGMNQWGARILARDYEWDYRKILFFYYSNVELR